MEPEIVTHPTAGSIPWGFTAPGKEAKAAKAAGIENPDTANRKVEDDEEES
jgi:hypothetical protein